MSTIAGLVPFESISWRIRASLAKQTQYLIQRAIVAHLILPISHKNADRLLLLIGESDRFLDYGFD